MHCGKGNVRRADAAVEEAKGTKADLLPDGCVHCRRIGVYRNLTFQSSVREQVVCGPLPEPAVWIARAASTSSFESEEEEETYEPKSNSPQGGRRKTKKRKPCRRRSSVSVLTKQLGETGKLTRPLRQDAVEDEAPSPDAGSRVAAESCEGHVSEGVWEVLPDDMEMVHFTYEEMGELEENGEEEKDEDEKRNNEIEDDESDDEGRGVDEGAGSSWTIASTFLTVWHFAYWILALTFSVATAGASRSLEQFTDDETAFMFGNEPEPEVWELMGLDAKDLCATTVPERMGIHDCVEATLDSGASHSVASKKHFPGAVVRPSLWSKKGVKYQGAGQELIANEGEADERLMTAEGVVSDTTWQIANVRNPLMAASSCNDKGNPVFLDNGLSCIISSQAPELNQIESSFERRPGRSRSSARVEPTKSRCGAFLKPWLRVLPGRGGRVRLQQSPGFGLPGRLPHKTWRGTGEVPHQALV